MKENIQILLKYFPDLNAKQVKQFEALYLLYADWNEKINVISRKDMDNFYERHVLHSLAICKVFDFKSGTKILDIGCGGGFPGIPLAILFPEVNFHLVDAIGKKITVVNAVAQHIGLQNLTATHTRVENITSRYDFTISRAVTDLKVLLQYSRKVLQKGFGKATLNGKEIGNGIICLKGGDLNLEISEAGRPVQMVPIGSFFTEDFFGTKSILYLSSS